MTDMDLGGISMNTGTADANGALWYVTGWEGWDSPNLRQSFGDPTSRHGQVVQESLLGSRAVNLSGVCKAPSSGAFWTAYNRLLAVTAVLRTPIALTVTEDVAKTLYVIRSGQVRHRMIGNSAFEFEVPLLAQDPLKYAAAAAPTTINAAASATLTNTGSFQTQKVTVTTTSAGTVSLTNNATGQTFGTGDTTAASGTVYEFSGRTAYAGSDNRYFQLAASSQWWSLEPGANSIVNGGTANVSITFRSAWV